MSENVVFKFRLGDRVKDRVTGYKGIIDMRGQCLNGCVRYSIQAPVSEKDGAMPTGYWIDEAQLEFVDAGLNDNPVPQSPTGGPVIKSPNQMIK